MSHNIDSYNSSVVVDREVGSGGSYSLNGHNNQMKIDHANWEKIVILGHNNTVSGTKEFEKVNKLVVIGHNNVIKQLMINRIEVLGHNNSFKSLFVQKQPKNNGFNNKFSNVGIMEQESDNEENVTYDTYENQNVDSSSSSSSQSDDDEEYETTTHNFHFNTGDF